MQTPSMEFKIGWGSLGTGNNMNYFLLRNQEDLNVPSVHSRCSVTTQGTSSYSNTVSYRFRAVVSSQITQET